MAAEELSYVIVTPYSIRKSRTGGILARLISRTGLDLVAARMFAPSAELVEKYAASIVNERTSGETIRDTYGDYVADANGQVTYFEPGVLAPPDAGAARADLLLWS